MLDVVISGKALAEVQSPTQTEETLNPNRNLHGNASGQQAYETFKGTVFTGYYSMIWESMCCLTKGSGLKGGIRTHDLRFYIVQGCRALKVLSLCTFLWLLTRLCAPQGQKLG